MHEHLQRAYDQRIAAKNKATPPKIFKQEITHKLCRTEDLLLFNRYKRFLDIIGEGVNKPVEVPYNPHAVRRSELADVLGQIGGADWERGNDERD